MPKNEHIFCPSRDKKDQSRDKIDCFLTTEWDVSHWPHFLLSFNLWSLVFWSIGSNCSLSHSRRQDTPVTCIKRFFLWWWLIQWLTGLIPNLITYSHIQLLYLRDCWRSQLCLSLQLNTCWCQHSTGWIQKMFVLQVFKGPMTYQLHSSIRQKQHPRSSKLEFSA